MPTKSSSLSYRKNSLQSATDDSRAIAGVLKRHSGKRYDLYGSNVRTPCSPRAMRYDIRSDRDLKAGQSAIVIEVLWYSKTYHLTAVDEIGGQKKNIRIAMTSEE